MIISWLESISQSIVTGLKYIWWLLSGTVRLGTMLTESVNIFAEILDFFPAAITSTLIAICGGLIVFRIFGRS